MNVITSYTGTFIDVKSINVYSAPSFRFVIALQTIYLFNYSALPVNNPLVPLMFLYIMEILCIAIYLSLIHIFIPECTVPATQDK